MLDSKDCKVGLSLILLSSLDHIYMVQSTIKNVSRKVHYLIWVNENPYFLLDIWMT